MSHKESMSRIKNGITKKCLTCNKSFYLQLSNSDRIYCSQECYRKDVVRSGKKKKGEYKECENCNKIFYAPLWLLKNNGGKFCSHKCYSKQKHDEPWNKGSKGIMKPNGGTFVKSGITFNGTSNEYKSLHYRISKLLGKPDKCEFCGGIYHGKYIHWANKSGKYLESPSDWIRLCKYCHFIFDNQGERRIKNARIFLGR